MSLKNRTRIREARFMKSMSQDILRLKTGLSNAQISRIERGLIIASDDQKKRISKALGHSQDYLFPEK